MPKIDKVNYSLLFCFLLDNVNSPRTLGLSGFILDSARVISNKVHTMSTAGDLDMPLSYFSMQFGQFLDHDIT
jgi:hypothetical protein